MKATSLRSREMGGSLVCPASHRDCWRRRAHAGTGFVNVSRLEIFPLTKQGPMHELFLPMSRRPKTSARSRGNVVAFHFRQPGANGKIDRPLIGGISRHPYDEARKRFRNGPANEEH